LSPEGGARAVPIAEVRALLAAVTVLDVRPEADFESAHVAASGNIPADDLEARRHELPPESSRVLVVAAEARAAERAARALESRFSDLAWLDAPVARLLERDAERGPGTRLWRPAPFLESVAGPIPRGPALDLACGAGREAVFLALHGFAVEAWDHDPDALARCATLARRSGVALETRERDLEADDPGIPEGVFALVTCFRFLHRPLFAAIERALAPGGHLVYETYRVGQERFGRPRRPRFLVESGELPRAFAGLEILAYEEPSPPAGPLTARLHARRR